jgi:hypothetical protein
MADVGITGGRKRRQELPKHGRCCKCYEDAASSTESDEPSRAWPWKVVKTLFKAVIQKNQLLQEEIEQLKLQLSAKELSVL